jgi:hypothetical protein
MESLENAKKDSTISRSNNAVLKGFIVPTFIYAICLGATAEMHC